MANYKGIIKTNQFHVKAEKEADFKKLMDEVCKTGVFLYEGKDKNGGKVYGFGTKDPDNSVIVTDDDMLEELRLCVADDDAVIMMEVGSTELRYVVSLATIITSKGIKLLDMASVAMKEAAQMLGNEHFTTKLDF